MKMRRKRRLENSCFPASGFILLSSCLLITAGAGDTVAAQRQAGFPCTAMGTGYYADTGADCTGYFMCTKESTQGLRFACSPGTRFQQKSLVCDHAYSVKCEESEKYFFLNKRIGFPHINLHDFSPISNRKQNDAVFNEVLTPDRHLSKKSLNLESTNNGNVEGLVFQSRGFSSFQNSRQFPVTSTRLEKSIIVPLPNFQHDLDSQLKWDNSKYHKASSLVKENQVVPPNIKKYPQNVNDEKIFRGEYEPVFPSLTLLPPHVNAKFTLIERGNVSSSFSSRSILPPHSNPVILSSSNPILPPHPSPTPPSSSIIILPPNSSPTLSSSSVPIHTSHSSPILSSSPSSIPILSSSSNPILPSHFSPILPSSSIPIHTSHSTPILPSSSIPILSSSSNPILPSHSSATLPSPSISIHPSHSSPTLPSPYSTPLPDTSPQGLQYNIVYKTSKEEIQKVHKNVDRRKQKENSSRAKLEKRKPKNVAVPPRTLEPPRESASISFFEDTRLVKGHHGEINSEEIDEIQKVAPFRDLIPPQKSIPPTVVLPPSILTPPTFLQPPTNLQPPTFFQPPNVLSPPSGKSGIKTKLSLENESIWREVENEELKFGSKSAIRDVNGGKNVAKKYSTILPNFTGTENPTFQTDIAPDSQRDHNGDRETEVNDIENEIDSEFVVKPRGPIQGFFNKDKLEQFSFFARSSTESSLFNLDMLRSSTEPSPFNLDMFRISTESSPFNFDMFRCSNESSSLI
ncbi:uncharacterized protein LOC111702146 isoform X2 [Eurytemora carolleeae]|uniref:uncharacterized protein LOC111702146 isoform X2 n=1 Tax=Eurytemora carolleeae TaxID=1294199 RepID=UPI000C76A63C|nr:uncharacterized protein LOC111702146 isoform X2 [Eurytemora carolleeae]|eukprot:XP_023329494.1 uncharacterized protein LOC111702146 isoform X2 [Eurytemora affinis]